ncbi:UNVERIFIED_CONTAM: hypothetical protein FKN15_045121 [Acipenser sinensis]
MFPTLVLMVLLCLVAGSLACDAGTSPFKSTGIACRVTKPAALICKEINTVANIMADFIQERAELFLSDGDIGVDISLTTSPSMRASYIESHHKGLVLYRKVPSSFLNESVFSPALLSESRMLYFWISDQVLNPMVKAAHEDRRFIRHIAGDELKELFQVDLSGTMPDILHQIISSENPVAKVWSLAAPELLMVPQGTIVKSAAAVELRINSSNAESPALYIETGYVVIQLDFGFPHHLLVDFLKKNF